MSMSADPAATGGLPSTPTATPAAGAVAAPLTVPTRGGQARVIAGQRRRWQSRAATWSHDSMPGLGRVVDAVLETAEPRPDDVAVDLGCGSGQLSLPLARRVRHVVAVDVSEEMVRRLREKAAGEGITNVDATTVPIEQLAFPPGSVDLVVSNYALHHLRDEDKVAAVAAALTWLRPGGRLVIGDMMLGRGGSAEDRKVMATKAKAMLRRGPAGLWRVGKNAARLMLRLQERPLPRHRWERMLRDAGFTDVAVRGVVAEAAVASGRRPLAGPAAGGPA